jgi:PleD family two-component response regulator
VSASDPGEFEYDDVFAEADLALYRSKQEGRNRVRVGACTPAAPAPALAA